MLLTSLAFFIFVIISVFVYYRIKTNKRWIVLLIASILFYCTYDIRSIVFVLLSSICTFVATKFIGSIEKNNPIRKRVLVLTLLLDFGILAITKYVMPISEMLGLGCISIIVPLGISFYTFQLVGYILDVYWGRDEAEDNYLKLLLFTIYFPQIIQGPISRHKKLKSDLENESGLDFYNIKFGIQLIIWGLFKKIVIADTIATAARTVLHNPADYYGISVIIGILSYCVQLYGDFSGGIDVIRGVSQLYGIILPDNFKRPFFSTSIAEFWRRWHITLGTWMKDYLFYPLALSKSMNKLGKKCQKVFGRVIGRKIPMAIENIVVFLVVGIWHGASWHFIFYGLYNGLIIAISLLLEPFFDGLYSRIKLDKNNRCIHLFRIVRTFILVNIGWIFDDVNSLKDSWMLVRNVFVKGMVAFDGSMYLGLFKYQYAYVILGCIVLFTVSILQERGLEMRKSIDKLPIFVKVAIWTSLIFLIPLLGWDPSAASGFMYANF